MIASTNRRKPFEKAVDLCYSTVLIGFQLVAFVALLEYARVNFKW